MSKFIDKLALIIHRFCRFRLAGKDSLAYGERSEPKYGLESRFEASQKPRVSKLVPWCNG